MSQPKKGRLAGACERPFVSDAVGGLDREAVTGRELQILFFEEIRHRLQINLQFIGLVLEIGDYPHRPGLTRRICRCLLVAGERTLRGHPGITVDDPLRTLAERIG